MKKIIALVAGAALAFGLMGGTASADDGARKGWDRQARPVAKPKVYADINTHAPKQVTVRVRARKVPGTRPDPRGARYRVERVNPRTGQHWTVSRGAGMLPGDVDTVGAWFSKAKHDFRVRVVAYGKVVRSLKIRVEWPDS